MNYRLLNIIGKGTFGKVYLLIDTNSKEYCVGKFINHMDNDNNILDLKIIDTKDRNFLNKIYEEFIILSKLKHPNIIRYVNHFYTDKQGILITEYGGTNIVNKELSLVQIKTMMRQILSALYYLHQVYIHRDIKPPNIVMQNNVFKIIDFGTCIEKETLEMKQATTIWYCAPEILLGDVNYSTPVDIWALGCVFYEKCIHHFSPKSGTILFDGENNYVQLYKIFSILGTPSQNYYPNLTYLPHFKKYDYPNWIYSPHKLLINNNIYLDFLLQMLKYSPLERITASQALQHEYFNDI